MFCFNQDADVQAALLRHGNVASSHDWRLMLVAVIDGYRALDVAKLFRMDAAFAIPELYAHISHLTLAQRQAEGEGFWLGLGRGGVMLVPEQPGDGTGLWSNRKCRIEGFLSYWDEVHRRHPGILIDSCASGGRRDDLETMRRAVPLLRFDFENNPEAYQCHSYGFGLWLPVFDAINYEKFDKYYFRSTIDPFLQYNGDVRKEDFDVEGPRIASKKWRNVAKYYFGEFWSLSKDNTKNEDLKELLARVVSMTAVMI